MKEVAESIKKKEDTRARQNEIEKTKEEQSKHNRVQKRKKKDEKVQTKRNETEKDRGESEVVIERAHQSRRRTYKRTV